MDIDKTQSLRYSVRPVSSKLNRAQQEGIVI